MSTNRGGLMVASLFARFGADTTEFEKKMRKAVTGMLFAAESLVQSGRIMTTAISAPMAAIAVAALKMAIDFDRAMMKIQTLVGVNKSVVAGWKNEIMETARVTGRSSTEMADALFFITSNGHKAGTAMTVLRESAMAAATGLGETKDIAFAATSAMNAYGKGSMTAAEAVSVLVMTVREGNLEAAELPPVLGQILPIAAAMGIEFQETGAAIATMTRSGTSARLAALGLKSAMLSLMAPTTRAAEAIDAARLSVKELQSVARNRSFIDAVFMMADAADKSNVSLKEMFPNAKAYTAVMQMVGESADATREIHENLAKTVGEDSKNAFEETAEGAAIKYDRALANLSTSAVTLGQNLYFLIDYFEKLTKGISKTTEKANNWSPMTKGIVTGLAEVLFVIGPVIYGLGSLARLIARFTGLSILFKAAWIQKVASMMVGKGAALTTATSFDILGASVAKATGLIVGALIAGYQFGGWLDETFKVTEGYNKIFGDVGTTSEQLAKTFKKDTLAMQEAALAAQILAQKVGAAGLAFALQQATIDGDADQIAHLVLQIDKAAGAYNEATVLIDGMTIAEKKAADQAAATAQIRKDAAEAEADRLAGVREEADLYNAGDIQRALADMVKQREDLLDSGVKDKHILEKMKEDWIDLMKQAQDYNVELPKGVTEMSQKFALEGKIPFMEIANLMYGLKESMVTLPGEVIPGMVKIGNSIATSLNDGFKEGAEGAKLHMDGFNEQVTQGLRATWQDGFAGMGDAVRDEIHQIIEDSGPFEIKIKPDEAYWDNAYNDTLSGNRPLTGG